MKNSTQLSFHLCTKADYDDFYEPAQDFVSTFEDLKKQKTLFCMDDDQILEIYGGSHVSENQVVEMIMLPCQYKNSTFCNST